MNAKISLTKPRGRGKGKIGKTILSVKFSQKPENYIGERMLHYGLQEITSKHYKGIIVSTDLRSIITLFAANAINPLLDKGLGMAYIPASEEGFTMNVETPDAMTYEIHVALRKLKQDVGSIFKYVQKKLKYNTAYALKNALAAEQIDAVALAIYNIEKKGQGIIIGDQTGIGKGRQAAAMIRYAIMQGKKPVFLSEKPNLFSDLYRDLIDIDSANFTPFIVNAKDSKTGKRVEIKSADGTILHSSLPSTRINEILENKDISEFDFIMATYSQFRDKNYTTKKGFLEEIAKDNVFIMDESHNASGNSNSGEFLQGIVRATKGIVFLSATFAKRPDNMPIYALKTSMSDASMTKEQLIDAVEKGGNALQEVISAQLVADGQMIRRERTFDGISIETKVLEAKKKEHWDKADKITDIIRDIIEFQTIHIDERIYDMNEEYQEQYLDVINTKGTKEAGISNAPAFSRVFNMVNQLLLALKAEDVAAEAILELEAGRKPVIALANTMGAALADLGENGDIVNADFKQALMRALDTVMKYTVKSPHSSKGANKLFTFDDLTPEGQRDYLKIADKIKHLSSGLHLSPIDYILYRIREAGFTADEVTGRNIVFEYGKKAKDSNKIPTTGKIVARKKIPVFDLFNKFNNNELDCLIINQSGSTGASAHAKPTAKIKEKDLKQRIMLGLQSELNINTEIQKMGRINRTGQLLLPMYRSLCTTIPAEQRLVMMMQNKLKSLNANTSSNQKQNEQMIVSPDFLNKYGDKVVFEYLKENNEVASMINIRVNPDDRDYHGIASKASGRFAILPVAMQEKVYNEILQQYYDYVEYLKQNGDYDLEMTSMPLEAELENRSLLKVGLGTKSSFGTDTFLDRCKVNNLRKPFTKDQLEDILHKELKKGNPEKQQEQLLDVHKKYVDKKLKQTIEELNETYIARLNAVADDDDNKRKKLIAEQKERAEKLEMQFQHHYNHINSFLRFFKVGMSVNLPSIGDFDGQKAKGVFLGYHINMKANNPFAYSNVKLRFAIADSRKSLILSCSGDMGKTIERIRGLSYQLDEDYRNEWSEITKTKTVDRVIRYIITGNILQAYAKDMAKEGQLTSYTMKDGSVMKGIIMPETWSPKSEKGYNENFISVPVAKALPFIMSLTTGKRAYNDSQEISILKTNSDTWEIIIAGGGKYKAIFLNERLIAASENKRDGFEKVSGMMKASFSEKGIKKAIPVLADHGLSITVAKAIYDALVSSEDEKEEMNTIKDMLTRRAEEMYEEDKANYGKRLKAQKKNQESRAKSQDKTKVASSKKSDDSKPNLKLAKAKAMAIKIKLQLLKL